MELEYRKMLAIYGIKDGELTSKTKILISEIGKKEKAMMLQEKKAEKGGSTFTIPDNMKNIFSTLDDAVCDSILRDINYLDVADYKRKKEGKPTKAEEINSNKETEYQSALSSAEEMVNTEKYNDAISYYKKALEIKPDENHPKEQINSLRTIIEEDRASTEEKSIIDKKTEEEKSQKESEDKKPKGFFW
jgi:hypothetical protein